jgi:hypothetical protein
MAGVLIFGTKLPFLAVISARVAPKFIANECDEDGFFL